MTVPQTREEVGISDDADHLRIVLRYMTEDDMHYHNMWNSGIGLHPPNQKVSTGAIKSSSWNPTISCYPNGVLDAIAI